MSCLPSSGILCSRQQVNWVSETHNGQLMYRLIQVAIGCRDPQIWVTASAELTYSSSHLLHAWHTVISVIDICLEWRHHVTGGIMWPCSGVVSSARCNYNADLAVQQLELCRPRPSSFCKNLSAVDNWPHNDRVYSGRNYTVPTSLDTGCRENQSRSKSITRSSVMVS